jgi:hypothetical protein
MQSLINERFILIVLYVDLASSDKNILLETLICYALEIEIHRDRTEGLLSLSLKIYTKCS